MNNRNYITRLTLLLVMLFALQLGANAQKSKANHRKAIDLGLSVKWANMNLGASDNFDYGKYYSWGEISTKRYYGIRFPYDHYRLVNNALYYKKYNSMAFKGSVVDNLTQLDRDDDAATVNWGKRWRMPTQQEINELITMCTWEIVVEKGHHAYKVTGPNGNFIILPFGGYHNENIRFMAGTEGYYWSKDIDPENPRNGLVMHIKQGVTVVEFEAEGLSKHFRGLQEISILERSLGGLIRPVREKK